LAELIPTGWAFSIVGLVWAVVAAVLAINGRKQLQEMQPLPQTTRSLQEDAEWARQQKT
jgi:Putative Actinobacterial Holin-X, holin superfamily III